jgi:hypothetical protein
MAADITSAEFTAAIRAAAREATREFLDEQSTPRGGPAEPTPAPDPFYPDAESFYRDYVSPVFARDPMTPGIRWCSSPFEHPEFAEVMGSMWQSYEFLRANDPAMGVPVWIRDWGYPLLDRLFNEHGTFLHCTRKEGGHDSDESIRPLAEVIRS